MASRIKRYIGEHSERCHTREEGTTDWCLPKAISASKNGMLNRGHYTWIQWSCNEMRCPALVIVRQDAVLAAVAEMAPADG